MTKVNSTRLRRGMRGLIDQLEPKVAAGYAQSVSVLRNQVPIGQVTKALAEKDIEAALDALYIEGSAFTPFRKSLEFAFEAGGNLTALNMPRIENRRG